MGAIDPRNKQLMWQDEAGVRQALVAAAQLVGPTNYKARLCSLGALQNLSAEATNRRSMWVDDPKAVNVVVDAARLADPSERDVRERALATLWNLSARTETHQPNLTDHKG